MKFLAPIIIMLLTFGNATLVAGEPRFRTYTPQPIPGTDSHLGVEFLSPAREWERLDVWVPEGGGPHPCVIVFYGGGYGDKIVSGGVIHLLVNAGYAVALPDYALGSSSPEPLVFWDGAAAIRWLRANSERLRIDPSRIGAWGFSAGGWLIQGLAPADEQSRHGVSRPKNKNQDQFYGFFPALEQDPANGDQPLRLQAVISDWGADKLRGLGPILDPTDPPLLTCHNGGPGVDSAGLAAYRAAGAPAFLVSLEVKNTHVPAGNAPGIMDGAATTWNQAALTFLERELRRPSRATAPEAVPAGGPIPALTEVALRSVHGRASIRYTLDGSEPTATSARLTERDSVQVAPGQVLRALSVVDGLTASAVLTATFTEGPAAPRIVGGARTLQATAGQAFSFPFTAEGQGPLQWIVAGHVAIDRESDPKTPRIFFDIDRQTGLLSGQLARPGIYPLIVSVQRLPADHLHKHTAQHSIRVSLVVE